ncbi:MAG: hypothetical protein IT379_09165 [Deltaproteobacteria bacterium]|nr:hypothetical protein [Deltaproteobacteria bacterium]
MAGVRRVVVAILVLASGACDDAAGSSVHVVVSEGEPALATRLDRIELTVVRLDDRGAAVDHVRLESVPSFGPDGRILPWSQIIRPATEGDSRVYRYRAAGFSGGSEVVSRQARLPFLSGTRLVLPLRFDGDCVGRACAPEETCAEGVCRDDFVSPCSLLSGDRSRQCDAGATMDAPVLDVATVDVATDVATSDASAVDAPTRPDAADVGPPDLGPPVECSTVADCDDDDLCTEDLCDRGVCARRTVPCDDGQPCTIDECVPRTGECVASIAPDETVCGLARERCCAGACTDVSVDPRACGGCGIVCGVGASCSMGRCACDVGRQDCDSEPGCESIAAADPEHCGDCATRCGGATPSCIGGACGQCETAGDCPSDGLPCRAPVTCAGGLCTYAVVAGACLIAGACRAAGERNPADDCEECAPGASQTSWSLRTGACDDGRYCTVGDACSEMGGCMGAPRGCSDGNVCTADLCNDAMARCENPVAPSNCLIGIECWGDGFRRPTNPCEACRPSMSQTSWSPVDDDTECGTNGRGNCCSGTCQEGNPSHCSDCADECLPTELCHCALASCFCDIP